MNFGKTFFSVLLLSMGVSFAGTAEGDSKQVDPKVMQEPADTSMHVGYEIDANVGYVGSSRTKRGNQRLGNVTEISNNAKVVIAPEVTENMTLRLGGNWDRLSFGTPSGQLVPNTLQAVNAVVGMDVGLSDQWLMRLEAQPGAYSDFNEVTAKDINVPFILGAVYFVNKDLQWFFGLRTDIWSSIPVLPVAGVRWKFEEQWTLNLLFPKPRIEYEVLDDLSLHVGAGLIGGSYRVGEHFGDRDGKPGLNNAIVDYSEVRLGPGLSWKINEALTLEAETGAMVYRTYDFHRADLKIHSEPAPFGELSINAKF